MSDATPRSWPTRGPDFNRWFADAAAFTAMVQAYLGFWVFDHDLKYLEIRIDTRDGAFLLTNRDGVAADDMTPDRVLAAINQMRQRRGLSPVALPVSFSLPPYSADADQKDPLP